jgi:hypothetical protein
VIGAFSVAIMIMAPAPTLYVPPAPAAPKSGKFECQLLREGNAKVRVSGELGVAPPGEKGVLLGRVRIRSEEAPELGGIYVAEWQGSYFSLWRSDGKFVSMHFHHNEFDGTGAAIVESFSNPTGRGTALYAGLCSHSLSHKAGAVIR